MIRALPLLAALLLVAAPLSAEISVVDSAGRTVTLERPAERIVGLAPHIVENLFSAGAGDKLVGAVSYSNYPAAARSIPEVGSAYSWSLETVVSMAPDLVVLWGSGNGIAALARLERLGLAVYVSEPRELADISASIRDLGELAGSRAVAGRAADAFDRAVAELAGLHSAARPLTVFYQIWNSPLQTVNGEHMISRVIALCGGRNIFAEEAQLAPRISLESVLSRDPEVIVASGMGESRPEWLDQWKPFASLQAVQRGRLYHLPPDLIQRPTLRIAEGAAELCALLDGARNQAP